MIPFGMSPFAGVMLAFLSAIFCGCSSTTTNGASAKNLQANVAKLQVGMTPQEVVSLVGMPAGNNRTTTADGTIYQWIYTENSFARKDVAVIEVLAAMNSGRSIPPSRHVLYVFFSNEHVIAIRTMQGTQ